jgi:hypothetical protein
VVNVFTVSVFHDSCATFEAMRNVTITLDDRVATWARVRAAQLDQSLSGFVSDLLRTQMERAEAYDAAHQAFLSEKPVALKRRGRYPRRESLHDRRGLR